MSLLDQVKQSLDSGSVGSTGGYNYPAPIPGRVAHIDADFISYQVSAESKEELDPGDRTPRKSLEDMQHNAKVAIEHIMRLCACTDYHIHTTPSGSTKGGRPDQVVGKEYQANRSGKEKPEHLEAIRAYIVRELGANGRGTAHLDQEADDGMAQAAWSAYYAGEDERVVVASKDKDLRMCPGYQLIGDKVSTFEGTFGFIELDRSKSAAKVTGRGTKFFWAQCLMGDAADNIGGIPQVTGENVMAVTPTKAYLAAVEKQARMRPATVQSAEKAIEAAHNKSKPCGAVLTYELLKDCSSDVECYRLVKKLYDDLAESGYEFTHWRTGEPVKASQQLLGDMYALWMRRSKDPKDALKWIKEIMQ